MNTGKSLSAWALAEGASKQLLEELHIEGRPKGPSSASSNPSLSLTIFPDSAAPFQRERILVLGAKKSRGFACLLSGLKR